MVMSRLFKIKIWEMEYSAVTILSETTQVGSALSVSKRSSASSSPLPVRNSASSSSPLPVRNSASSSSSPSFRSDITGATNAGGVTVAAPSFTSLSLSVHPKPNGESFHHHDEYYTRRARISFLLAKKKKKVTAASASSDSHRCAADMVFKRSKSTTTPRRGHFMDAPDDFSPRKRNGFWSFLYHNHKASKWC